MMKQAAGDLAEIDVHLSEDVTSYPTFASMGIRLELLKGIYKYGFDKPSVIQQKSIRQIIDGRDVIAQYDLCNLLTDFSCRAQSGTGKTATFSIGTLHNVCHELRKVQVLVLAPTRELANQIHQVMSALSDYLPIRCVACCGGRSNVAEMSRELSKGAHVVVGTPGRVLDLICQGSLRLDSLRSLVLDEADEMLNRGLREQLDKIYRRLPSSDPLGNPSGRATQVVVVSATMPLEHLRVIHQFTNNPVHILVPRDELTLSGLHQFYIDVGAEEWKFEALGDLFASVCVPQTVVFVNTRHKVDWLSAQLRRDSFTVESVHGDLDQTVRETVMDRFRSGASRILVSSDIWARGIDVQQVGLVVNYDLPASPSDYLHRIGRSGRFGRRGLAISLTAGPEDQKRLATIARYYKVLIHPAPAALDKLLLIDKQEGDTVASKSDATVVPSSLGRKIKANKRRKNANKHV
ncbi:ATP-dependent RNA helicase [Paragonimus westermani]|uniref:RNA helicase n=1 Tax=Paragonimus westermani TaxID=34504 RepID=A0A5J4NNM4_9TREM|nr:ATP-dependent RNA helicase [Paragonimus westermani]